MAHLEINKLFEIIKLPFSSKYRYYTSVTFFLLLAVTYLSSVGSRYKVSEMIALSNSSKASVESVATGLGAKPLIQKAIDQLSFEVNYYKESSPRKEIYGDSLPVKLVLNDNRAKRYANDLLIKPVSSHSYSLEHEDTIQFFEINEAVNKYYGRFKIVKGPAFNSHFKPVIMRLNQPLGLFKSYYHSLTIRQGEQPQTIVLSILVSNAQKGKDFLDKLLELYIADNKSLAVDTKKADMDSLKIVGTQIASLQVNVKKSQKSTATTRPSKIGNQQLRTLEVIKPYLQKPVRQFIQVPYTEEIENAALRNDLDDFNKIELDKQRLIAATKIDDLAVQKIDKQLNILKVNIVNQIEALHNGKMAIAKNRAASVEKQLQAARLKYNALNSKIQSSQSVSNSGVVKVTEKSGNNIEEVGPHTVFTLLLALLLGLVVPLAFNFIETTNTSPMRANWFNRQTFIEKIKILLGVGQID